MCLDGVVGPVEGGVVVPTKAVWSPALRDKAAAGGASGFLFGALSKEGKRAKRVLFLLFFPFSFFFLPLLVLLVPRLLAKGG